MVMFQLVYQGPFPVSRQAQAAAPALLRSGTFMSMFGDSGVASVSGQQLDSHWPTDTVWSGSGSQL